MKQDVNAQLFSKLIDKYRASQEEVRNLLNENIVLDFGGKSHVLGNVKQIEGHNILFDVVRHPFHEETNFKDTEGRIEVFQFDNKISYGYDNRGNKMNFIARKIHYHYPNKILVMSKSRLNL